MKKLLKLFRGKKTHIVGVTGNAVAALDALGVIDLEMGAGALAAIALGSTGGMTLRAGIAKLEALLADRLGAR